MRRYHTGAAASRPGQAGRTHTNGESADERDGGRVEQPLLTSGDDLRKIGEFAQGRLEYSASDVLDYLLSRLPASLLEDSLEAAATG